MPAVLVGYVGCTTDVIIPTGTSICSQIVAVSSCDSDSQFNQLLFVAAVAKSCVSHFWEALGYQFGRSVRNICWVVVSWSLYCKSIVCELRHCQAFDCIWKEATESGIK